MRTLCLFAIVLAVLGLTSIACSENVVENVLSDEEDVLVIIDKHNLDTEAIHIFARFEDFPCCRIEPGEINDDSSVQVREGERVEFTAGRNGTRFASVTCTVTGGLVDEFPEADATVEFRLDQSLRCRGW
jgi:hypothetical protein